LSGFLSADQARLLDQTVSARRWDIHKAPFKNAAQFDRHIDHTTGHLMWIAASALGPASEEVVRDAAYATGVANWLRAIPELEARGRVPMVDGSPGAVQTLSQTALSRLQQARRSRAGISRAARPALMVVADTETVLRAAMSTPGRVGTGQLPHPGAAEQLRFTWRAVSGRW
jgi:hypothetical protein